MTHLTITKDIIRLVSTSDPGDSAVQEIDHDKNGVIICSIFYHGTVFLLPDCFKWLKSWRKQTRTTVEMKRVTTSFLFSFP